jgi:20S proteasome alpha/beta subunit
MSNHLSQRKVNPVTVCVEIACQDGVVIGADRKVVRERGTRIESLEDKIVRLAFQNGNPLLCCSAGGADLASRAISLIDPSGWPGNVDADSYRDSVERAIAGYTASLNARGIMNDSILLFGMINLNDEPVVGHITPMGLTETRRSGYFTAGIAAPYAEMVLQDSFHEELNIQDAKLIVGGLIVKIGQVDNGVEGMDVLTISSQSRSAEEISFAERQAIETTPLSFDFSEELDEVKEEIEYWLAWEEQRERAKQGTDNGPPPASQLGTDSNGP